MRVAVTNPGECACVYAFSCKRIIAEILWYVEDIYPQTDWILVIALARLDYQGCVERAPRDSKPSLSFSLFFLFSLTCLGLWWYEAVV